MRKTFNVARFLLFPGCECRSVVWNWLYTTNYRCTEGDVRSLSHRLLLNFCPRLCHPERYGIRKMIHKALVIHTTALDSPPTPELDGLSLQQITKCLRTLLQLFDEVLLEGYCRDHESLALVDHLSNEQACHFCGSCLFLSCFRCIGGCSNSERDSLPGNSSICVCPACYVEGRTCGCGNMDPERLSGLSHMLQDRNHAADALSKFQLAHGVQMQELLEISEEYISCPRRQNITQF